MTSVAVLKRKVEKLEEQLAPPRPEDIITVYMWSPDGKDKPYNGGPLRIKALPCNMIEGVKGI